MKFLHFFPFCGDNFGLRGSGSDWESESGSADPIESGSVSETLGCPYRNREIFLIFNDIGKDQKIRDCFVVDHEVSYT